MSREALRRIKAAKDGRHTTLDLSGCGIKNELPEELGELEWLLELDLSVNGIGSSAGPRGRHPLAPLEKLTALTTLNLRSTKVEDLKPIQGLTALTTLDLGETKVADLKPIQVLTALTTLDLPHTQVADLKPIEGLTALATLYLSHTQVADLKPIQGLTALTTLDLERTQVADLKPIHGLTALTTLDLERTQVADLKPIQGLTALAKLELGGTHVADLKPIQGLTALTTLDLRGTQVADLKPIQGLTALTRLDLSGTHVADLKPIQGLTALTELYLRSTKVADLKPIQGLTALTTLHLYNTKVADLKPIQGLTALIKLHLELTQVADLKPIQGLIALTTLDLAGTQVADLKPLEGLTALTTLDLRRTQVADLKPIQALIQKRIPAKFGGYNGKNGIYLQNCPLTNPPLEIAQQGNEAILAYWERMEAAEGPLPLNEAKVILIGDGAAGKTSLLKRLLGEGFDPRETQTNGIHIRKQMQQLSGQDVLLRFWDFGGQEIMHATHRFFLTKRALYIVVLDARKDDQQAEYWLDHVKAYGGDSRVLIVINKVDENPSFAVNEKGLREKHGERIAGIYRLSCKRGDGLEALKETILSMVDAAESTHTPMPKRWRLVKDDVEGEDKDYISYVGYREICTRRGMPEESEQNILLRLLNDLGIVLNFEALKEHDTAVLNPEWLTNAVYRVINSGLASAQNGEFAVKSIGQFLDDPKYADKVDPLRYPAGKHAFIAEAMAAFELCYRLPERVQGQPAYLIPELLPVAENSNGLNPAHCAHLELHYTGFLPPSVLPRFIVQMHPWVIPDMAWRTGVCLHNEAWKAQAVVRLDRQERKLRIAVAGQDSRVLMEFIRDTFRLLHAEFKGLGVQEFVPLDGGKDFVKYADLAGLEKLGELHYVSGTLLKKFPIAELLNGLEDDSRRNPEKAPPVRIFVSYSHKYPHHKANLLTHLAVYSRAGKVEVWDDGRLEPGSGWKKELWRKMTEAEIIILIISPEFLASEFLYAMEFQSSISAMWRGEVSIVPIVAEPCMWQNFEELAELNVLPLKRAIALYRNENQAWIEIMSELHSIIESHISKQANRLAFDGH